MGKFAARGGPAVAALFVLTALCAPAAHSVPLTVEELTKVCAEAEDASHCGRLVEAVQLPRLPSLAVRDKLDLRVSLYPSGTATFTDVETLTGGGRSYSLWDFMSEINAVVLYVTEGDDARFMLMQRTTGRKTDLPSDPKLSPDRARIVTADFCERRCTNELTVWRVTRDSVQKELVWSPVSPWTDAVATWKDPQTLTIDYSAAGAPSRSQLSRRIADTDWARPSAPLSVRRPWGRATISMQITHDAPPMQDEPSPRRPIRSFVLRQGRMSPAQERALLALWPAFGVPYATSPLDFDRVFGRRAPRVLDIGFGMGETTAMIALAQPDIDFLAIDVHGPGVGSLLNRIADGGLANVRVMRHDAVEVVTAMIAPGSLAGVHVFFPDPWPKKRHHKRRLLTPPFVRELALRLVAGGYLHVATDWEDYAQQVLATLAALPLLENTADGFAPRPPARPLTKFEARGMKLGHGVRDLVFRRRPNPVTAGAG